MEGLVCEGKSEVCKPVGFLNCIPCEALAGYVIESVVLYGKMCCRLILMVCNNIRVVDRSMILSRVMMIQIMLLLSGGGLVFLRDISSSSSCPSIPKRCCLRYSTLIEESVDLITNLILFKLIISKLLHSIS
jgi:hypothetical protein